jgi:hypothetical protein
VSYEVLWHGTGGWVWHGSTGYENDCIYGGSLCMYGFTIIMDDLPEVSVLTVARLPYKRVNRLIRSSNTTKTATTA